MAASGTVVVSATVAAVANGAVTIEKEMSPGNWHPVSANGDFNMVVGLLGPVKTINIADLDLGQVLRFLADDDVEHVAILALERDCARFLVDGDDFGFGLDGVADDHARGFGGRGGGLRIRRMGSAEGEGKGEQRSFQNGLHD